MGVVGALIFAAVLNHGPQWSKDHHDYKVHNIYRDSDNYNVLIGDYYQPPAGKHDPKQPYIAQCNATGSQPEPFFEEKDAREYVERCPR